MFRILAACGVTFVHLTHGSNFIFPFLFDLYPSRISLLLLLQKQGKGPKHITQ